VSEQDERDEQGEDFAAMFEASLRPKRFEKGQTLEGRIVGIGAEVAFVDVGGKGEATIDLAELKDADGNLEVAVGDRVHAVVTSTAGGLVLSRRLARGAASARQLEEAFQSRLPVEGKVESEVKGGYEIRLAGQRAFCPYSQIDIRRTETPATHVGQVYQFRIIEYKEAGRTIVVSRRALLEEEQRANAAEVRKMIVPGAVLKGRVASVREFGAFIDFGAGVQGLLHVSEMSWSRVSDPAEIVKPGDEIAVKVLRVEEGGAKGGEKGGDKISLGLKQLTTDPWSTVATRYEVGQVMTGKITRIAEFGAFVELEPGIEALAHASTFPATGRRNDWSKEISVGMTAAFEVVSIEPDKKRVGIAMVPEGSSRAAAVMGWDAEPGESAANAREARDARADAVRGGAREPSESRESHDAKGAGDAREPRERDAAGREAREARGPRDASAGGAQAAPPQQPPPERLGSLADKLRGALGSPRRK
jgi:small subunit ribosomal protein S1